MLLYALSAKKSWGPSTSSSIADSLSESDQNDAEVDLELMINGEPIEEVSSTKFLGVIIDNELTWQPHIDMLSRKLRSATGAIKRIRTSIPKECYKAIYYALFQSHLSYCITVFGKASRSFSDSLFTTQKSCMRILFGDLDAYIDKFKTCARARPYNSQTLGTQFFMKEHTKPLFNEQGILSFDNLYNYHSILETLKILKSSQPCLLYEKFNLSSRGNKNILLARADDSFFVKNRIELWNSCVKILAREVKIGAIKTSLFKSNLKDCLLKIQNAFGEIEWYRNLNADFSTAGKIQYQCRTPQTLAKARKAGIT